MLRHDHMYMVSNKAEAKLRGWGKINCLDHKQMYWRFDGKFLRNEKGKYVARQKPSDTISYLLVNNPWHIDREKMFENEGLFWEHDPASNAVVSTTEPRAYLTNICWTKTREYQGTDQKYRDCGERLGAREKLEDNTETKGNEALEQRFLLDYQGKLRYRRVGPISKSTFFSDPEVLRRR